RHSATPSGELYDGTPASSSNAQQPGAFAEQRLSGDCTDGEPEQPALLLAEQAVVYSAAVQPAGGTGTADDREFPDAKWRDEPRIFQRIKAAIRSGDAAEREYTNGEVVLERQPEPREPWFRGAKRQVQWLAPAEWRSTGMAQLHAFEWRKRWLPAVAGSGKDESRNSPTAIPAAESVRAATPGRKQWLPAVAGSGEDESRNAPTAIPAAESVRAATPGRMADIYTIAAASAASWATQHRAVAARVPEFPPIELGLLLTAVARHAATHRFPPRAVKLLWRRNAATLQWRQSVWQAKQRIFAAILQRSVLWATEWRRRESRREPFV